MLKKFVMVAAALLVVQSSANAALYRWVDEKGNVNYSNRPQSQVEVASPKVAASNSRPRSFPVPLHGNLVLSVPESWDHEISQPPGDLPPTIVLTPREGDDFKVLITALWSFNNDPGFQSPQALRRLMSDHLARMLPTAVERSVPIEELQGNHGTGYFFSVTDKAPGPSYPYMLTAGIGTGELMLITTILSRTKDSEGVRQTLKALQGAVQIKK